MQLGICTLIAVIVYFVIELVKHFVSIKDSDRDMLPIIGALLGAFIGLVLFFIDPTTIGTTTAIESVLMGLGSGLAATGGNQIYKKVNKMLRGDFHGLDDGLDDVLDNIENMDNEDKKE